jgi:hypothetical protein
MRNRSLLTQDQKRESFAEAFRTVKVHRDAGNYLAAFVIAFSIFEDRVLAAIMSDADLTSTARPKSHVPLHRRIEHLRKAGHIDQATETDWKAAGNERNDLLHAAMWRLDVFDAKSVARAVAIARSADRVAKRLRQRLLRSV